MAFTALLVDIVGPVVLRTIGARFEGYGELHLPTANERDLVVGPG